VSAARGARRAARAALPGLAWWGAAALAPARAPGPARAADDRCGEVRAVPDAVRPFVAPGACAIAVERADLDRDGRADYLVVLDRRRPAGAAAGADEAPRPVLVLAAAAGGGVRLAARGPRAVLCPSCGGAMGDPFVGVAARAGGFTVRHYGGAGWRWSADFTFGHSRRDGAWQLVRVEEVSFHAGDPAKSERRVSTPPRDYGRIDLGAFDPEDWRGRGAR
jgi:hypothetical protein